MVTLLFAAATAFLRAFAVTFLLSLTGILAAPDVETATALSIAGLIAAIAGGLRAIQVFIPQLSFGEIVPQPYAAWVDAFVRTFLATLVVSLEGLLAMPELPTDRSVWFAALQGAVVAGVRALQGLLTPGEAPKADTGVEKVSLTR